MMMTSDEFIKECKEIVCKYENEHMDTTDHKTLTTDDVYVVWMCFIPGNQKCLLSTTNPDGMYFELMYNNANNCIYYIYFDAYKKWENKKIEM